MLQKRDFLIVFILFLIGFILRFYFADFLKHFVIYPDELRYYHLAENIAHFRGLLIYNTETNFQKILYPLFLSPAFLFENREIQQHIFAFINSFLVCSAIFPAFLIAKELLQKKSSIFIVCAILLILPDLNYSLTFMSENLYIPLSLWVFYAYLKFILNSHSQSLKFVLFLGVLSYALYLCKEIAAVFPLSFLLYLLFLKRENFFKNATFLILGFFIPFFILNFTLFSGLSHSYSSHSANILSFEILKQPGYVFFFFYAFLYFLMHVAIASGYFTLTIPFLFWQHLNKNAQKTIVFLLILIFTSALVITYTIYLKEDFYEVAPRALLRYLSFIWIPLLSVFLSLLEKPLNKPSFRAILYFLIPAILIFIVYKGANANIHHTMLYFLDLKQPIVILNFKIAILIGSIIFALFFHQNKKIIAAIFLILFSATHFVSNIDVYSKFKGFYSIQKEHFKAIEQIEDLIKSNPQKNFVIGNTTWGDVKMQGLLDSFLNYPNVYTVHVGKLSDNPPSKALPFSEIKLPMLWHFFYDDERFYNTKHVDYYILPKNLTHFLPYKGRKPVLIDIPNSTYENNNLLFHIYKNKTPAIYSPIHLTQIEN